MRYLSDDLLSIAENTDKTMWGYIVVLDKFGICAAGNKLYYQGVIDFLDWQQVDYRHNNRMAIWLPSLKESIQELLNTKYKEDESKV